MKAALIIMVCGVLAIAVVLLVSPQPAPEALPPTGFDLVRESHYAGYGTVRIWLGPGRSCWLTAPEGRFRAEENWSKEKGGFTECLRILVGKLACMEWY